MHIRVSCAITLLVALAGPPVAGAIILPAASVPAPTNTVPARMHTVWAPTITLSTTQLHFVADEDDDAKDLRVLLTNSGTGKLHWRAAVDVSWLDVSPNSGNLDSGKSKNLKVEADSDDLPAGVYTGTITITGNATNSPQTIDVTLTINGTGMIGLSTSSLAFSVSEGQDPADQTVTLTNTGGGTLDWDVASDVTWLSVAPVSGSLSGGASQDLTVSVASAGLAPGTYSGTLTVTGNASNSPQTIDVDLTVTAGPAIGVSTSALTFNVSEGQDPADQTVTLTNTGGGTLNWDVASDATWLSAAPISGSLSGGASQDLTVSVASAGLAPGTYSGTLTVTGNAKNSPQTIDVDLTVTAAPTIGLSATSLSFDVTEGEDPPDQFVTITNDGGGSLDWDLSADADWLSMAPGAGSLSAGGSQDVVVSVASADLTEGSYSGLLTVTGNASNSPRTIDVELAVSAAPAIGVSTSSLTFSAPEDEDPPEQTVTVTNRGGGTLEWQASSEASWLTVVPESGALPGGAGQDVTVSVSTAGLAPGTHEAEVEITDVTGAAPQKISVSLQLELVVSIDQLVSALAGGNTLDPGQIQFLDAIGNGNGGFDLGDFLAWLENEPQTAAPRGAAIEAGFGNGAPRTGNGGGDR